MVLYDFDVPYTINLISLLSVSYDAAVLDELQSQKNVIFVVSGTNDNRNDHSDIIRVGSPADSLNSLVVNAVRRDGTPVSYSRKGNILSFFNKPDVAYYGGRAFFDRWIHLLSHIHLNNQYSQPSYENILVRRIKCQLPRLLVH